MPDKLGVLRIIVRSRARMGRGHTTRLILRNGVNGGKEEVSLVEKRGEFKVFGVRVVLFKEVLVPGAGLIVKDKVKNVSSVKLWRGGGIA